MDQLCGQEILNATLTLAASCYLEVLPTEIGRLTQLTDLDLSRNSLKELPTQIGLLSRLTILDLEENKLVSLPTQFGRLTHLSELKIGANRLEMLPTEFGQLMKLISLDFDSNSLIGLPTEFGLLTRLSYLSFHGNNLETLPREFGQLAKLVELDLRENSLQVLPIQFFSLKQLTWLDLGLNRQELVPTEFGMLTSLKRINFATNGIEKLPTEIGELTLLTMLDLDMNSLGALPTEFGNLAQLTQLDLQHSSIEVLPTEFGKLAQLESVDFLRNSLATLPTEFGHLTSLTELTIVKNKLQMLPTEIGQLTNLTEMYFQRNSLKELPTEFGQLTQLTELDIEGNSVKVLPTEFGKITQLQRFSLEKNGLELLPFEPRNINVTFARSASIDLTWLPPALPLSVVDYTARVTSGTVTATYRSFLGQTVATINLLHKFPNATPSQNTFTIQIRAEFEGVYRSLYSEPLSVRTCPASMERENTNEVEACYALAGFYRNRSGLARSCTSLGRDLPPAAIGQCLKARLEVPDLPVQRDFWRPSLFSEEIRLCPNVRFCQQQQPNVSLTSPDGYCSLYHSGIYCSDCAADYVLGLEGCTFCTEEAKESKEQLVLLTCTMLLLLLFLYVYVLYSAGCFKSAFDFRRSSLQHNSERTPRWKCCTESKSGNRMNQVFWTKLRILFGYFQVLSSYRRTFLQYSISDSGDILGVMGLLSNFDLTWLVGNAAFRCVYDYDHYDLLIVATIGPIVVSIWLFVSTTGTTYCIVPRLMQAVRHHTESALLLMLFLIYPYVSQTVFGTFWCESFPDADRRFNMTKSALRADYRLSCEHDMDANRHGFEIYAGIMVAVYPAGVVGLYSWVLYMHKNRIVAAGNANGGEEREKLAKVAFLTRPYKVKRFWFEAYELVRKLVQTSFVGFLADIPIEQALRPAFLASITLNLTFMFVVALALLKPYKYRSDFAFAIISLLLLLPASQYSMVDPYARDKSLNDYGLTALVITELCMFVLFVLLEICFLATGDRVRSFECVKYCCEGAQAEKPISSAAAEREIQDEKRLNTAMRWKIVELEVSRERIQGELERLREKAKSCLHQGVVKETSIQPL